MKSCVEARFLTPLRVEQIANERWLVKDVLIYISEALNRAVLVPAGFETDFASVPRLPFVYLAFGNTAHSAAVVHDYLYSTEQAKRSDADRIFLEAMKVLGIPFAQRWAMYAAVRTFGGSKYGRKSD